METIETLGKYEIRGTLGRGAMGTVLDGWDPSIQRRVAIKTVPVSDSTDPEIQEQIARFKREAQAAGRLTHPNIVSVYDYGETDTFAYIVMEFVEGPTLKSLTDKQERFAMPDILRIMQDLLAGLEFSHERGVVHRDIKPANLMLTSQDRAKSRVKIADFGIARIESSSMTQPGTMMGTPAFMSPEQFMAETVDSRTDIYSSGVLLYQLLTGERPFEGGLSAIMHKVLQTEPPPPSRISVTSPPALDAVVGKAMAKRPSDRFATAAEFAAALVAAASAPAVASDDATMVVTSREPTPARAPKTQPAPKIVDPVQPRRGLLPVVAGVALVLAAAGGGSFFWFRAPSEPVHLAPPPEPTHVVPPAALPSERAPVAPAPKEAVITPNMISDMFAQITATQRCAFIGGTVHDNNAAVLTGIAGPGVQGEIRGAAASRSVPGSIVWQVAQAQTAFCPALELLQSVAPPFGVTDPKVALTLVDNRTVLHDGERIRPRLVMPNFPGYVRVDYITHDGNVQHLFPQVADSSGTAADKDRVFAAGERLNLGDPPPGQPTWEVGEPYGTDMIITVVSSEPLFPAPRAGNVEAAGTYLRDLDAAVQAVRGGGAKLVGNALLVDALAK